MAWLSERQQQSLQDMGVQLWRSRQSLPSEQTQPPEVDLATQSSSAAKVRTDADIAKMLRELVVEPVAESASTPETAPEATPETPAASTPSQVPVDQSFVQAPVVAPFELICAHLSGQMLVWQADENTQMQGFAADLLAAMANNWRDPVDLLSFRWPLSNAASAPVASSVSSSPEAVAKTVTAFLTKQVEDLSPQRIFATQTVVNHLTDSAHLTLQICADLAELATSEVAKREFWQLLQDQ